MLDTLRRRLLLSHLIPVLLVVPVMGFAFEYLLGAQAVGLNRENELAGTLCEQLLNILPHFTGLILLSLFLGSLAALVLAGATERPLRKIIHDIELLVEGRSNPPLLVQGPQEIRALLNAVNSLVQQRHDEALHHYPPERQQIVLSQWLPQALETWREAAGARRLDWEAIIPADLPALTFNPGWLKSTIDCLLRDAIHSAPSDGRISVHLKMVNDAMCITVSNSEAGSKLVPFTNQAQDDPGTDVAIGLAFARNASLIIKNDSCWGNAFMLWLPVS